MGNGAEEGRMGSSPLKGCGKGDEVAQGGERDPSTETPGSKNSLDLVTERK